MKLTEKQEQAIFTKIRSFIQTDDIYFYSPESKKEWEIGFGFSNYNISIKKFKPCRFGYYLYNVIIQNKGEFLSNDLNLPKDIVDYFEEYHKINYPIFLSLKTKEEIQKSEYEKSRVDSIIGII